MRKKSEGNTEEKDSSLKSEKDLERQRISFSARLISCLEDKKKEFNKRTKSNIKIQQLREVYLRGVSSAEKDLNLHGLARVNMFLRMKEHNKATTTPPNAGSVKKVTGLILEGSEGVQGNNVIDISDSWAPEEEDFKEAVANVEKYDLNLDFKNINELYLEPYKPIQFEWD